MDGFLFIDKDSGMTSFDVVREVKKFAGEKKVGHSGTLDPLATGLMIVALGQGTKLLEYLIGCDKEYETLAVFGAVSDSFDADGQIRETDFKEEISQLEVEKVINKQFKGEILQAPPKYSALKVNGKRACDIVRSGGEVELASRKICVYENQILDFDWPMVKFRIKCSAGTYVRSLVNDLGVELGCGAYVKELRRIAIGSFGVKDTRTLNELRNKFDQELVSLEMMAGEFQVLALSDSDFEGLKDGKVLLGKKVEQDVPVMAFYKDKLVGVLKNVVANSKILGIKYAKVIL